ncbi:MAG: helix-turn-helix transcriptional regulator [Clostridia bacterium]|nr:helix-turn-helix transcriptional regulator [Clostridia bacterium]
MTLADKIITLRKKQGWSQEELAERVNVTRQSVSKWESSLSVPDLDKIVVLAELFGVSCDYLLREDAGRPIRAGDAVSEEKGETSTAERMGKRPVTSEETEGYLSAGKYAAPRIATGVLLCILGAAVLILSVGMADTGVLPMDTGVYIGLGILILLVCIAVLLFIASAMRYSPYSYMGTEALVMTGEVRGDLCRAREAYRPRFVRGIIIGVSLCILSLAPLFIALALSDERDPSHALHVLGSVSAMLVVVACGVFSIVLVGVRFGGFGVLLEEGEYAPDNKRAKKRSEAIQSIFWLAVTAGYLAYSFTTHDWGRSWVVWPVAAILSGVIEQIFALCDKSK